MFSDFVCFSGCHFTYHGFPKKDCGIFFLMTFNFCRWIWPSKCKIGKALFFHLYGISVSHSVDSHAPFQNSILASSLVSVQGAVTSLSWSCVSWNSKPACYLQCLISVINMVNFFFKNSLKSTCCHKSFVNTRNFYTHIMQRRLKWRVSWTKKCQ